MNLLSSISWLRATGLYLIILAGGLLSCRTFPPRPKVVIETSLGDIKVEVYTREAPVTAGNFLSLVESGSYDSNAEFYRVVRMDNQPNNDVRIQVIQGGLFRDELIESFTPIRHETTEETGIRHLDGVISMARMEPGSASTEFFICIGDQSSLDFGGKRNPDGQGFATFGRVVEGMDVVRAIHSLPNSGQYLRSHLPILTIRRIR